MQIGLVTDSLGQLGLDAMLAAATPMGIERLEFGCGNWSSAPHPHLETLLDSAGARREILSKLAAHGTTLSALNCSGNPLHPGEIGRRNQEVTSDTIRLAGLVGVERVVMMSGCPGGQAMRMPTGSRPPGRPRQFGCWHGNGTRL